MNNTSNPNNEVYYKDYIPYEIRVSELIKSKKTKEFTFKNFRRILRYSRSELRNFLLEKYGRIPTGTPIIDKKTRKQQGITFTFRNENGSLQRDYLEVLKNFREPIFLA